MCLQILMHVLCILIIFLGDCLSWINKCEKKTKPTPGISGALLQSVRLDNVGDYMMKRDKQRRCQGPHYTPGAARKVAEDGSEYESTTENQLEKGSERLPVIASVAASIPLENDPQMSTLPISNEPRNMSFVPKISWSVRTTNQMNDVTQCMIQEYSEEDSRILGFESHKSYGNKSDSENCEEDDNRYNILNAKLNKCLKLLGSLTVDMKELKQRTKVSNSGIFCDIDSEIALKIKRDLPLKSRAEVNAFEEKLLDSLDYRQQFARIVSQIGGANGKEYTERVLNTIFSPAFAADNTWEGKMTKYKINKLNLISICEEVILKKFSTWDSAEFSKAGTNWFRLGNQRAGQQPKQVQKKTNSSLHW